MNADRSSAVMFLIVGADVLTLYARVVLAAGR